MDRISRWIWKILDFWLGVLGINQMFNIDSTESPSIIFGYNSGWLKICLVIMFLAATLIRLDELHAPGHLLDREYTSAIFARAYYFTNNENVEDWRRDIAVTTKNQQPVLESPLLEYLVSVVYRVVGREDLAYSRYLTSAFWLLGGAFLFLSARKLLSVDEAMIATAYYLFVPMGIIISRSFQPDSLMMMLFLICLYLLVLYFEAPSTKRLLVASILVSITLMLRPLVIFSIFCTFLAFSIYRNRSWKNVIDLPIIGFSLISLLPFVMYYGYGILFAGFMRWKVSTSFMPFLLVKKDFWLGWWNNVMGVAEFTPLILAILGFFLLKNRKVQYMIVGLVVAYMLFSVAFTYHIHTHPYYHIQLFPIVGLCFGAFAAESMRGLKQTSEKNWWIPVIAVGMLALFVGYREVRNKLYLAHAEDPTVAAEIGEIINHSPHTVFVAYYYGLPLEYYGEFGGAPWPVRIEDEFYRQPGEKELSVQERISRLGFEPEYFVITHFDLFERLHQDLQAYLDENCQILAQTNRYLIYNSCQPLKASETPATIAARWEVN